MKERLKKKLRKGIAMEFLLNPARNMTGIEVAKWLEDLHDAYAFCQSSGCQFVLSSGARSPVEMVSGNCFDEILKELEIDPSRYWRDLNQWLEQTLARKVIVK